MVKTRLIAIGNSQGIRIPKPLIEQVGLNGELTLEAQGDRLIIRADRHPRQGWEAQIKAVLEEYGEEPLSDFVTAPSLTEWDDKEWEW